MQKKPAIALEAVSFSYGPKAILSDFNLKIEPGKIYCLVGSSGSGKTTCLRLMNGLLRPQAGKVLVNDQIFDYKNSEKIRRSMGYSIQGSGLFPHMSLSENLSIIARKEKMGPKKISNRIFELCELLSLPSSKNFLSKKPREISGGQQQRVGIARALFMKPNIMLMDEPFSALDPITRTEIQTEFIDLQRKLNLTIVIVTHDLPEAFTMAHEIVLLRDGMIEQKGRPSKFLLNPSTQYVRDFIHTNSPGNLMREIHLYSVMNSDVFSIKKQGNQFVLANLETKIFKKIENIEQARNFLIDAHQNYFYWVDEDENFLSYQSLNSVNKDQERKEHLKSTTHIINGMKSLLNSNTTVLPVVSESKKFVGVFSEEALDAL